MFLNVKSDPANYWQPATLSEGPIYEKFMKISNNEEFWEFM